MGFETKEKPGHYCAETNAKLPDMAKLVSEELAGGHLPLPHPLDKTPDERQRSVGNFSPAAVDSQSMPAVWNFDNFGQAAIARR
jgi:hypothetical protein